MSDEPLVVRRVFIPFMSDHAHTVAASMRHHGIAAEVLPEPDDESMAIGLDLCRGRECLPCFLCTGDIIRRCRSADFDPAEAVFFMPTGPGPCRFGQYRVLQHHILTEQGFGDVRLVSPTTEDSYALFGADPRALRKLAWQGIVAVDLLAKLLHEHRPYERAPGSADATYRASLDELVGATVAGGGRALVDALERAAERFQQLEIDRSEERPLVAVVGELYLMLNAPFNRNIVRSVEATGGEVLLGTFMDWLYYSDWCHRDLAIRFHDHRRFLGAWLTDAYQRRVEKRFTDAVEPALRHGRDAPIGKAMKGLRFCYDPGLGTEASLTMGRTLDLSRHGISGVVNVLPFSCMPGTIVSCMAPKLRDAMGGVPWLDVSFDGQKETNIRTRLEAFMHQAFQFYRRVGLGDGQLRGDSSSSSSSSSSSPSSWSDGDRPPIRVSTSATASSVMATAPIQRSSK